MKGIIRYSQRLNAVTYYYRPHRFWYGYWADNEMNQIGDSIEAPTRDEVLIALGNIHDERLQMLTEKN